MIRRLLKLRLRGVGLLTELDTFCRQVRARSSEHRRAIEMLHPAGIYGQVAGILRLELDSMVRVIFLLSILDDEQRKELVKASVDGKQWTHPGLKKRITDREMVDLANKLQGWTESVYRFGCAFIHLSSFHDYNDRDPMELISDDERKAILDHMQHYYGGPNGPRPSFHEIIPYLPRIFDKVASNLEYYLIDLAKSDHA